jgi:hypothetical protein
MIEYHRTNTPAAAKARLNQAMRDSIWPKLFSRLNIRIHGYNGSFGLLLVIKITLCFGTRPPGHDAAEKSALWSPRLTDSCVLASQNPAKRDRPGAPVRGEVWREPHGTLYHIWTSLTSHNSCLMRPHTLLSRPRALSTG